MLASVIGLRAKATAIDVPSSSVVGVLGGEQQRQERVVAGLGRPARPSSRPPPAPRPARRPCADRLPMPPSTFMAADRRWSRRSSRRRATRSALALVAEEALELGGELVAGAQLEAGPVGRCVALGRLASAAS